MKSDRSNATGYAGPDRAQGELLRTGEVAEMIGISKRSVLRLFNDGQMPPPISVGRMTRWRRSDIASWITDGCPVVPATEGAAH